MDITTQRFTFVRVASLLGAAVITVLEIAALVGSYQNGGLLRSISDWVFRSQPLILGLLFGVIMNIGWMRRRPSHG